MVKKRMDEYGNQSTRRHTNELKFLRTQGDALQVVEMLFCRFVLRILLFYYCWSYVRNRFS